MKSKDLTATRKSLGWTLEKLARQLDVTTSTVWRWERQQEEVPKLVEYAVEHLKTRYRPLERELFEITLAEPKYVIWSALRIIADKEGFFRDNGIAIKSLECDTAKNALRHLQTGKASVALAAERLVEEIADESDSVINLFRIMESESEKAIKGVSPQTVEDVTQFVRNIKILLYPKGSDVGNYLNEFVKYLRAFVKEVEQGKNLPHPLPVEQGGTLTQEVVKRMKESGEGCAFFGWEPYTFWVQKEAKNQGLELHPIRESIIIHDFPIHYNVAVERQFAERHFGHLLRFMAGLMEAEEVIENSKMNAVRIVAQELLMDEKSVEADLKNLKFECSFTRKARRELSHLIKTYR